MIHIRFKKGEWEPFFQYAYNERFSVQPAFVQEGDCIVNKRNDNMPDGFEYTTIMTKEKYKAGTKICFTCSFEAYGAPLITLTDTLKTHENGNLSYRNCHEVVLWEHGVNVFYLFETNEGIRWNKLLGDTFSVAPGDKHTLCLEVREKEIFVSAEERSFMLRIENLPKEFYIGLTGCENINRIYSIDLEQGEEK